MPQSLNGCSVLDVGANAGYFALQTKLRSAGRVVATEFVKMFKDQAETIFKIWGVEIDYKVMDVHNVRTLNETFDIVVFPGILYHLKNPFQVIEDL